MLLTVLMVMLGLFALGVTALWMTGGNLQISANLNLRQQALYVAEAGVERARAVLNRSGSNVNAMLVGSNPGIDEVPTGVTEPGGVPNGVGALVVDGTVSLENVAHPPASFGRTPRDEFGAPRPTTMGNYTVWIRNDTTECRLGNFTADNNNSVLIRSRGVALDGRTTVVLEVTMGPTPGLTGVPGTPPSAPLVLCNSGKNACDDNNSVWYGIVVE